MARARVEITHPDRVLFPEDGITKRGLADYYGEVAGAMLPHLRDRALTVQRFPRGIGEPGFVQQDFAGMRRGKFLSLHKLNDNPQSQRHARYCRAIGNKSAIAH